MSRANQCGTSQGVARWIANDFEQSIPARFRHQVQLQGNRTALVSATWSPTFEELDATSNRVAEALLRHQGQRHDRVVLLMRHDSPLVAGVLGVLKAARIVVVLNPSDPPARLRCLVENADPRLILADDAYLKLARNVADKARTVISLEECFAGGPTQTPDESTAPGDIAFLVYTSGSTSRPKAVMRSHRSIVHNSYRLSRGMTLQPDDRLTLLAALSGGSGVTLAFAALLSGATLCPFAVMERGVTGLADWIDAAGITVYSSSSSLFRHFLRVVAANRAFPHVRMVRLSSEAAGAGDWESFRRHFGPNCSLLHTLSSSETGNIARIELTRETIAMGKLPIGKPVEDMDVQLLQDNGRPALRGEVGEIIVRSRYLASGYWRDESLTSQRFSFAGEWITFRSGDLGRLNSSGQLEFVGRSDARVKIRGYRIEPSEVESALRRQPEIAEVVVYECSRSNGDAVIVACLTCRRGQNGSVADLRNALRQILPMHMIPAEFVFLDKMPISPNGKIDRGRLREFRADQARSTAGTQPATDSEVLVAKIWRRVFQLESVSREDDFYALGGDSLMAAVIAANIYAELGVEIQLPVFRDKPTLQELAGEIDSTTTANRVVPLPKVSRDQPLHLSLEQELIWHPSQTPQGLASYVMANSFRIRGILDVEVLRDCMQHLVERHEILRTTFTARDGSPVAIVHDAMALDLPVLDFSNAADPQQEAADFFRKQVRNHSFDLKRLPLLRFWLVRISEHEYWLLRAHHHIISDNWSWKIWFSELAYLYERRLCEADWQLPPAPQYVDYAAWQRRELAANFPLLRRIPAWWKRRRIRKFRCPELPFQRTEPCQHATPADGVIWWKIDSEVSRRLDQAGVANNATYFVLRLAVFAAALAETGRQDQLSIGIYTTNRNRLELQNTFGMFASIAELQMRWNANRTFGDWLEYVTRVVAVAQTNSNLPTGRITKKGIKLPGIRAIFSVSDQNAPRAFGGIELATLDKRIESMPWGFSMKLDQHNEDRCHTAFDACLYDPQKVHAFLRRYIELLDVFPQHVDVPLAEAMSRPAHSVKANQSVAASRLPRAA